MDGRFSTPDAIQAIPASERGGPPRVSAPPAVPGPPARSRLQPRDVAVFLLAAAAEIEHALMMAGWSGRGPDITTTIARRIRTSSSRSG